MLISRQLTYTLLPGAHDSTRLFFFVIPLRATITKPLYAKKNTPEEVLNSIVHGINTGDLDSLMTLYEADACFASQPGQLARGPESIRQSLRGFIDLKGKLDIKVKRVLQASDLALVTSEWSFSGTGSDGNPVNMAAKSADILRHQPDGTWQFVIDNPWGTD